MECTHCGSQISQADRFCKRCGARVEAANNTNITQINSVSPARSHDHDHLQATIEGKIIDLNIVRRKITRAESEMEDTKNELDRISKGELGLFWLAVISFILSTWLGVFLMIIGGIFAVIGVVNLAIGNRMKANLLDDIQEIEDELATLENEKLSIKMELEILQSRQVNQSLKV